MQLSNDQWPLTLFLKKNNPKIFYRPRKVGIFSKIKSSLAPEKQSVIIAGPVRRVMYRNSENSFEILIVVSFGF